MRLHAVGRCGRCDDIAGGDTRRACRYADGVVIAVGKSCVFVDLQADQT